MPKDATCSDCLYDVTSYLVRHSLQAAYLTEANERIYEQCVDISLPLKKSIDVNDRFFLHCTKEAVAHMREAGEVLHAAVHRWTVAILARSATTDVVDMQPRYILLRPNSAESWGIKDYKMFAYDHVRADILCFSFFHS